MQSKITDLIMPVLKMYQYLKVEVPCVVRGVGRSVFFFLFYLLVGSEAIKESEKGVLCCLHVF